MRFSHLAAVLTLSLSSAAFAQVAGTQVGTFTTGTNQPFAAINGNNFTGSSLINAWPAPLDGLTYDQPERTYLVNHTGGRFAAYLDITYNAANPGGFLGTSENWAGDKSDIDLFLLDSTGTVAGLLAESINFVQPSGTRVNESIVNANLPAGTYYLVVDSYTTFDDPGVPQNAAFQVFVPEPASLTLLAGGAMMLLRRRRA